MTAEHQDLDEARRILRVEAETLISTSKSLDTSFLQVVDLLEKSLRSGGKLVLSGVGKSGNVAQKVAATLSSTGSPAIFVHPTDALHGDLGVLAKNDCLLLFSNGGSSQELLLLMEAAKPLCQSMGAVLGNPKGQIAARADAVVAAAVATEACPLNLAPTASSTLAMALGDALALVLRRRMGLGSEHFAKLHPGGALGRKLLTRVSDLMHKEDAIARIAPTTPVEQVLLALTTYRHSGVCIVDGKTSSGKPKLVGVITEGDIRRALVKKEAFFQQLAKDIMTVNPMTIQGDAKAADALEMMESRPFQLSFLPVVDAEGACVGILRIHDLVLAGIA